MGRKKERHSECVYCGKRSKMTHDHLPPKALFAPDDRQNLITVPCCPRCHFHTTGDDEYFKDVLTLREDVHDHPAVKQLLPSALRSFQNPHNIQMKVQLFKSFELIHPRTASGLILPKKPAFTIELTKVERVVERITKGLFFHEKHYRLPDDYFAAGFSAERLLDSQGRVINDQRQEVLGAVIAQRPKTIGRNVFTYKFLCPDDDPNASAWLFVFYEKILFGGLTLRKDSQ